MMRGGRSTVRQTVTHVHVVSTITGGLGLAKEEVRIECGGGTSFYLLRATLSLSGAGMALTVAQVNALRRQAIRREI